LWLTVFWGEPGPDDIALAVDAWERAIEIGAPYRSLVDARHVRRIDPRAFSALVGHLQQRRDAFMPLLEKQAIVRPDGVVGAVSAGVLTVVEWPARVAFFRSGADAIAWLAPGNSDVAEEYDRWCDGLTSTTPLVARLREIVQAELVDVDLERAARRMKTSSRSLQRHLREANTSFAAVLDGARLDRAKELLASSDAKIAAVAQEVGYKSEQRFRERFTASTGVTPAEWRARGR
jgi:AraC-like DNA-binding protein